MLSHIGGAPGVGSDAYELQRAQRVARMMAGDKTGEKEEGEKEGGSAPAPSSALALSLPPITGLTQTPATPENTRFVDFVKEQWDAESAANKAPDAAADAAAQKFKEKMIRRYEQHIEPGGDFTAEIMYQYVEGSFGNTISRPNDPDVVNYTKMYATTSPSSGVMKYEGEFGKEVDGPLPPQTKLEQEQEEQWRLSYAAAGTARRAHYQDLASQGLTPAEIEKGMLEFDISTIEYTTAPGAESQEQLLRAKLSHMNHMLGVPDTPVKLRVIDVPGAEAPESRKTVGLVAAAGLGAGPPSATELAAAEIGKIRDETASGERFAKEEEEEEEQENVGPDGEALGLGFRRLV